MLLNLFLLLFVGASWLSLLVILPLGTIILALHPHTTSWPIEGGARCASTGLMGGCGEPLA